MEQINFSNTYFTTKGMMPSTNESISLLWAMKVVNNLANTYGIIGTCSFNGKRGYRSLNLQLTKKYLFPPSVYLYYTDADEKLCTPRETHPTFGEYWGMDGLQYEAQEYNEKVYA